MNTTRMNINSENSGFSICVCIFCTLLNEYETPRVQVHIFLAHITMKLYASWPKAEFLVVIGTKV
jgi:hypothetical protein